MPCVGSLRHIRRTATSPSHDFDARLTIRLDQSRANRGRMPLVQK
jgi:hypothetical protein